MIVKVLAFVIGIWVLQHQARLPSVWWLIAATTFSSCVFISVYRFIGQSSIHRGKLRYFYAVINSVAIFLMGVIWAAVAADVRLSDYLPHRWEKQAILIEGVVSTLPEQNAHYERFRFKVEKVLTPNAVVPRQLGLSYYYPNSFQAAFKPLNSAVVHAPLFHVGERWRLTVKLKRPHGVLNPHGFDFESWALSENMRATGTVQRKEVLTKLDTFVWRPHYLVEQMRARLQSRLQRVLENAPYVGVIQALVIGDDSDIEVDTWQLLLRTGITHLMSISGLHITMLSGMAFACFYAIWRRFPLCVLMLPARKAATIAGIATACCYAFIAGFSVPTQRTFYMLMILGLSLWFGRQYRAIDVLAFALLVVVLIDPWAVNAAGFWLSFGAVALITFAFNGRIGQHHWLTGAIKTQWAVTIGMLPLLLILFNQSSVISPVANAIAIPVVSFFVTPLALLGSFLQIDWPIQLSHLMLTYLMQVLHHLDQLPITVWQQQAPQPWTFFLAMTGALMLLLPRGVPLKMFGVFAFLPIFLIKSDRPVIGDMKVTVLDVGQGLSVHVQTKGHDFLYDTGSKFSQQSDAGMRVVVPYLRGEGVSHLDGLMISHDDIDHSGGAQTIINNIPTSWVSSSYAFPILTQSIKTLRCQAEQVWYWDNVKFEVLYPNTALDDLTLKDNNKSCVLKVSSAGGSLLLTGDVEKKVERSLLAQENFARLKSDVMLVPHHGSKTSSSVNFLSAVKPMISIATVGYLNRFHHPVEKILNRYHDVGSQVFRSDQHGAIILMFTAKNGVAKPIKVSTWRTLAKRYWSDTANEYE